MKKLLLVFSLLFVFQTQAQEHHEHSEKSDSTTILEQDHSEKSKIDQKLINSEEIEVSEFPTLHPLVVHFPIVLILLAALLQLFQLVVMKRNLDWVILMCIGLGFIGAYVAGTFVHPHTEGLTETAKKILEHHDMFASYTIWGSAIAALFKIASLFLWKQKRIFELVVLVIMAFSAYSVGRAGHYGSQLVYIQGVGAQGQYLGEEGHHEH